jgi:hypothetical protein
VEIEQINLLVWRIVFDFTFVIGWILGNLDFLIILSYVNWIDFGELELFCEKSSNRYSEKQLLLHFGLFSSFMVII